MSDVWTFSSITEASLKRCMDVPVPEDPNNKWVKRFKKKVEALKENEHSEDYDNKTNVIDINDSDSEPSKLENQEVFESESVDEFLDLIQVDPLAKFDLIVLECSKRPGKMTKLAKKLSLNSIEKISNHLLNENNIDLKFLENFYINFIPTFLKRENCRLSLDLLVKANKKYPEMFQKTLNIVIKDSEIQSSLICDLAHSLNEDDKLNLLNSILLIDLTAAEFQYNLFTIFTLYRESKKNTYLQNHIESILCENSQHCAKDKNFGKFLMTFLKEQKNFGTFRQSTLVEKSIENNHTPFRKPCLNIFKDIKEKYEGS